MRPALPALVATLAALACTPEGVLSPQPHEDSDTDPWVELPDTDAPDDTDDTDVLPVPLLTVTVERPSDRPLQARLRVTCAADVEIDATLLLPDGGERALRVVGTDTGWQIDVIELREDQRYEVRVQARDALEEPPTVVAFRTGTLPAHVVPLREVVSGEQDGVVLLGTNAVWGGQAHVVYYALDGEGEVVWFWSDVGSVGGIGAIIRPIDDHSLLLLLPDEVRCISTWGTTRWSIKARGDEYFHHDARVLPDGNVLILSSRPVMANVPALGGAVEIIEDVIVEVDPTSGRRVWTWSSAEHMDVTRFPGKLSRLKDANGSYDWTHANALWWERSNDTILLSARSQSLVVEVDHKTGDVLRSFGSGGDVQLTAGSWFYSQHAPFWQGSDLWVYDNGNERPGPSAPYSRVVRYAVDGAQAKETWSYTLPTYTGFIGDVDVVGEDVFITAGGPFDNTGAHLLRVDLAGDVVWDLMVDDLVYRSEWVPSMDALRGDL